LRRLDGTQCAHPEAVSDLFARIDPLNQALDYHLERHNLLASNIAHVDTPLYKPVDLARIPEGGFNNALQVALSRTNANHIGGGAEGPQVGQVFRDLSAGGGLDGNFVSLDREAGKMAANQLRYDIVSVLVKSQLDGLMSAANDGRG
jgi:flagellar basal-body rod protein FlgB